MCDSALLEAGQPGVLSPRPGQLCPPYWLMAVPREGRTLPRKETCGSQTGSKQSPSSPRGSPFRGQDTFYEGSWLCLKVFVCGKCDLGHGWCRDLSLSGWDVDHVAP